MLTLILVFMEWPPRLHVLYIATAAAASFAYDPFRCYDMPELHEGKSMSVERGGRIRWSLVRLCANPASGKRISPFGPGPGTKRRICGHTFAISSLSL